MKQWSYFSTIAVDGYSYKLSDNADTLEEMKAKIDESNARVVASGYKAKQWIITHVEEYRYFDKNGLFKKSERLEQAICVYPSEEA